MGVSARYAIGTYIRSAKTVRREVQVQRTAYTAKPTIGKETKKGEAKKNYPGERTHTSQQQYIHCYQNKNRSRQQHHMHGKSSQVLRKSHVQPVSQPPILSTQCGIQLPSLPSTSTISVSHRHRHPTPFSLGVSILSQ